MCICFKISNILAIFIDNRLLHRQNRYIQSILIDIFEKHRYDIYRYFSLICPSLPVAKKLKNDKALERGKWDERVRSDENVCVVKWMNTKAVTMLSTCPGSASADTCKRWCKKEKKKIDVARPAAIRIILEIDCFDTRKRYCRLVFCYR